MASASVVHKIFRPPYFVAVGALAVLLLPSVLQAQDIDVSGQIALELRWFPENPAFPGQFEDIQFSGFIEPEFRWESTDRNTQILVTPFVRLDGQDDHRTHGDLREAYWRRNLGDWDVLVGVNRVFWGVTESRHLVNVINQIDAVEDVDEEDFLGQPMVQVGRQTDFGRFELFLMTGFRERTFPDRDGRLRAPIAVDTDRAVYESDLEEWRPDVAIRYSHYIGDLDVGFHVFHGTGREPELRLSPQGSDLIPFYQVITQVGADLQYTTDAWLFKFEGVVREGQGDTFAAAVAGVEYTFFQIAGSDADLGLIAEGLYDGRDEDAFSTLFDQDIFVGARLALNDVQSTELLAGLVTDVEDGLASLRVEGERRIGSSFKLEVEAQAFLENSPSNTASVFRKDSFLTVRISRFF